MRAMVVLLMCAIQSLAAHAGPLDRSTTTSPVTNGTSPKVPPELAIIGAYREGLEEGRKAGNEYEKSHGCYGHYLRGFKAGVQQANGSGYWVGWDDGYNDGLKSGEPSGKPFGKCNCQSNVFDVVGYTAAGIAIGLIAAVLLICVMAWFAEKVEQKRVQIEKRVKIAPVSGSPTKTAVHV